MIESVSDVLSTRVSGAMRYDRCYFRHPHDWRMINSIAKTSRARVIAAKQRADRAAMQV